MKAYIEYNKADNKTGRSGPMSAKSGQALTEAVIMLAIFGMAWVLCSFVLFMANNGIRTNASVRHLAWKKGNDGSIEADSQKAPLDASFFMKTGFLTPELTDGSAATDGLLSSEFVDTILGWAPDIRHAKVPFGVHNLGDSKADQYPFMLMKTKFPFMPETVVASWLKLETECEWEQIDSNWDDITPF